MFLASCSLSTPVSDLRKAARTESTQPAPDVSKRSTVVEAIPVPYSQMSVRINGGLAGRMVLASRIHGVEKWVAADGLTIWLRNHRIVGTQGFHQDLLASERLDDRSGPGKAFTSADSGTVSAVHYAELVGEAARLSGAIHPTSRRRHSARAGRWRYPSIAACRRRLPRAKTGENGKTSIGLMPTLER